ncbi:hypothetical protein DFR42_10332 [Undibacterium pigrum]|uniref:Uncharacterized protein n=1 Tax=Undibacterium pigrum TaxID=401470 RepID=A0A318JIX2_9BURK|nr:hypothetical protein DFR42_10332 [Undibacterium pigrum]
MRGLVTVRDFIDPFKGLLEPGKSVYLDAELGADYITDSKVS